MSKGVSRGEALMGGVSVVRGMKGVIRRNWAGGGTSEQLGFARWGEGHRAG